MSDIAKSMDFYCLIAFGFVLVVAIALLAYDNWPLRKQEAAAQLDGALEAYDEQT